MYYKITTKPVCTSLQYMQWLALIASQNFLIALVRAGVTLNIWYKYGILKGIVACNFGHNQTVYNKQIRK